MILGPLLEFPIGSSAAFNAFYLPRAHGLGKAFLESRESFSPLQDISF